MNVRSLSDGPLVSPLTRRVGSLHLALAGAGNVLVAVSLLALVAGRRLADVLVATLPAIVDEVALVANAQLILAAAAWGAPALGLVFLLVGAVQLYGGWQTYHARRWGWGVAAAALGAVNPVTLPISLVGGVLVGLSKSQFARTNGRSGA